MGVQRLAWKLTQRVSEFGWDRLSEGDLTTVGLIADQWVAGVGQVYPYLMSAPGFQGYGEQAVRGIALSYAVVRDRRLAIGADCHFSA